MSFVALNVANELMIRGTLIKVIVNKMTLARTGFKKPTLEQVKEKQALKRAKKLATPPARSLKLTSKPLKRKKATKVRTKLPKLSTMRNKCDALLTPITKKLHPNCLLCGLETQVGHHHIKKSTSSALRYYLPNLIGLCNHCHLKLHCDEILWTGRVIKIMGMDWLDDLEEKKNVYTKIDIHYYIAEHKRLSDILNSL